MIDSHNLLLDNSYGN